MFLITIISQVVLEESEAGLLLLLLYIYQDSNHQLKVAWSSNILCKLEEEEGGGGSIFT